MADNDDLELGSEGIASGEAGMSRGSGNHPVRKRIAIKLKPAGKEKTRPKSRKDAAQRRVLESDEGDRPIDELQFSSMVSVGLNEPIHKHSKLNWNHRVNLIGDKVVDPLIHNCEKCSLPILIYGRMIPCKHVFCYSCSKKTDKNCPRCNTPVVRIEQSALGTVFVCTYGGAKHGVSGCHRTYLSHRDLQSHMAHRHLARQEPAGGGGARQHDSAQIGPTTQQKTGGAGDQTGQVHHVQVAMGGPAIQQTMPSMDFQGHAMQVHPSAMQFNPNQPPPQLQQHDPSLIYLQVMQQGPPQVMQQQGMQQAQQKMQQSQPQGMQQVQGLQLQGMQPPPVMQQQGMQPQGMQGQGMQPPPQQGRQQPGIQPQGMQQQGMQQLQQGMPQAGMQPQQMQQQGMPPQHGMQQQGIPQQQQGMQQQGMPSHGMPPPQGLHLQVMPPQNMMLGPPHGMSPHLTGGPSQRGMQLQGLPPPGMQAPPQIQMIVHQGGQASGAPGGLQMMAHQGGPPPQDVAGNQQMMIHQGGPGGAMMNTRMTNLISVQLQDEGAYRRGEMSRGGAAVPPPHHEGQQMYVNQGGAPVAGQLFINPGSQQNPVGGGGVPSSYSSGVPHSGPLMSPASHHVLARPPQAGGGGLPQSRPGGPPPMNIHGGPQQQQQQQHVSYSPRQYEEHMSGGGGGGAPPRMGWNQPGSSATREQSPQQRFSPQTAPPGNMGPPRFYQQ